MDKNLQDIISEYRELSAKKDTNLTASDMSAEDGKKYTQAKSGKNNNAQKRKFSGFASLIASFIAMIYAFGMACVVEGGEFSTFSIITFIALAIAVVFIALAIKKEKLDLFDEYVDDATKRNEWLAYIVATGGACVGYAVATSIDMVILSIMLAISIIVRIIFFSSIKSREKAISTVAELEKKYEGVRQDKIKRAEEASKRIVELEKQAYEMGVQLCTIEQLNKLNSGSKTCPICSSELESSIIKNGVTYYAYHKKVLDGVYVASAYSNTVSNAVQYEYFNKEFVATTLTCPHCKYEYMTAEVEYYKHTEDSIGDNTTTDVISSINKGMLLEDVVDEWKQKHSDTRANFYKIKSSTPKAETKKSQKTETVQPINPVQEKVEEPVKTDNKLITCVDCGKKFSPHAKACPECGCPIEVCLENNK